MIKGNIFTHFLRRAWYLAGPPFMHKKANMYFTQIEPDFTNSLDGLPVTIGSKSDIDQAYFDMWHTKEQALKKLEKGDILFLVKNKGTNVFYGWAELSDIAIAYLDVKKINIPQNIGYISGLYVPPEYRNRRTTINALKFIMKFLAENKNIRKVFIVTSPDNKVINKIALFLGYTKYQLMDYIKILGLKLYVATSIGDNAAQTRRIFIHNSNFWKAYFPPSKSLGDNKK